MKFKFKTSFLLMVVLILSFSAVYAETVSLPSFDVSINGTSLDVEKDAYPPVVYKGITYLPMTFNYSRALGLNADWDNQTGLSISQLGNQIPVSQTLTGDNSLSKKYTASEAQFDIKINGQAIDNSKEEYPVLVFRNITYFPLTWHFMVDEFNLQYHFDDQEGLTIVSKGNPIPPVKNETPTTPPEDTSDSTSQADLTEIQISNLLDSKVFKLITYDSDGYEIGTGSGFLIDTNGSVATNYHVIEGAAKIEVQTNSDKTYTTSTVLNMDYGRDVAVIKVSELVGKTPVTLGNSDLVKKGQHIITLGSPIGLFNSISDGLVSNINQMVEDYNYIQITAPISPGSSGGVLSNYQGQIIGITSAQFTEGQNLNLVIPINEAKLYFKDYTTTDLSDISDSDWNTYSENYETINYPDGRVYVGEIYEELPEGYGKMTYPNGDVYEGYWYEGLFDYWGEYSYANGDVYSGDYYEGIRDGYGTYTYANGDEFYGEYSDDVRDGYGTFTWTNGNYYEGDYENDKITGYGYMEWANGDYYYGYFKEGKLDGTGTYYNADGSTLEGYFEAGKYLGDPTNPTDQVNRDSSVPTPTHVKARAIDTDSIEIGWDDVNADYYHLYYTDDVNGTWYYFEDYYGDLESLDWVDEYSAELYGLEPNSTFYFIVTSVVDGKESYNSATVSITTPQQ